MATTEKRPKLDTCPECGASLEGRDPAKHSVKHYGERAVDARLYPDAAKRQRQLRGED
jgi:hypothetical protein